MNGAGDQGEDVVGKRPVKNMKVPTYIIYMCVKRHENYPRESIYASFINSCYNIYQSD